MSRDSRHKTIQETQTRLKEVSERHKSQDERNCEEAQTVSGGVPEAQEGKEIQRTRHRER